MKTLYESILDNGDEIASNIKNEIENPEIYKHNGFLELFGMYNELIWDQPQHDIDEYFDMARLEEITNHNDLGPRLDKYISDKSVADSVKSTRYMRQGSDLFVKYFLTCDINKLKGSEKDVLKYLQKYAEEIVDNKNIKVNIYTYKRHSRSRFRIDYVLKIQKKGYDKFYHMLMNIEISVPTKLVDGK